MRRIDLQVDLFGDPRTRQLSQAALGHTLEALTLANQAYLRTHPNAPHPYRAGWRYEREPIGVENWQTYPYIMQTKRADCEDLAAALAAWRREREGIHATARALPPQVAGNLLVYHIGVQLPNGQWEDPSRVLGMGSSVI